MEVKWDNRIDIRVLPSSINESLYDEIKHHGRHLSIREEKALFSCIEKGDLEGLIRCYQSLGRIHVGRMSGDDLTQYKYLAVSFITLAVRYAMQGGLSEKDGFAFSDVFLQQMDQATDTAQITSAIAHSAIKLTNSVAQERKRLCYSPHVRRCIHYIDSHINKRLTVSELAEHCGLSADYLSHIFKQECGENLSKFIMRRKLEIAKQLLDEGEKISAICRALAFSSDSHFISLFKQEYGVTPKEYARR